MKIFQYLLELFSFREAKKRRENAGRTKAAADRYFPGEKWIKVEDGIYISARRSTGIKSNYKDELRDAQILKSFGSVIFLVPEVRSEPGKKYDAIVDGLKMEFKNMKGKGHDTLINHFYKSRKQAPNVFINLEDSLLSKHKIYSTLHAARNSPDYDEKNNFPEGGLIILKIRGSKKLIYLDVNNI